ncbi:hypothetical protein, partial [Thiolapillus sp.]
LEGRAALKNTALGIPASQHTTAKDGGSADHAGSSYLPVHPVYMRRYGHPWPFAAYTPSLEIKKGTRRCQSQ